MVRWAMRYPIKISVGWVINGIVLPIFRIPTVDGRNPKEPPGIFMKPPGIFMKPCKVWDITNLNWWTQDFWIINSINQAVQWWSHMESLHVSIEARTAPRGIRVGGSTAGWVRFWHRDPMFSGGFSAYLIRSFGRIVPPPRVPVASEGL